MRPAYDLIDASPAKYTEGNGNRVSCPEVSSAAIILSYDPWIEHSAIPIDRFKRSSHSFLILRARNKT